MEGTNPSSTETVTRLAEPVQITVGTNAKGNIQYEVNVHATTGEDALQLVSYLEGKLYEKYKDRLGKEK